MAVLDGKLLTLDVILKVWGVSVGVTGTVEILDVSKRV